MADAQVERAVEVLLGGGVVAFPTDTVYGIGALPTSKPSVDRIYAMKNRPRTRALIVHVHERASITAFAQNVPDYALQLAEAFWPGALTLVLPRRESVPLYVTGDRDTVSLRMPNHRLATQLIQTLNEGDGDAMGIAAPSANRFGDAPATTAQEVVARLGAPRKRNRCARLHPRRRCVPGKSALDDSGLHGRVAAAASPWQHQRAGDRRSDRPLREAVATHANLNVQSGEGWRRISRRPSRSVRGGLREGSEPLAPGARCRDS